MRVRLAMLLCCTLLSPAGAASLQEQNKAVALAFFQEVLDQGHLERYSASHAPDFVVHTGQGVLPLADDIAAATEERKAIPDMRCTVHQLMAEDDRVLVYWTCGGTNTGDGMGFHATGKAIHVPGMTLFRLRAGKIVEEWSVFDMLAAYQQAGLIPAQ